MYKPYNDMFVENWGLFLSNVFLRNGIKNIFRLLEKNKIVLRTASIRDIYFTIIYSIQIGILRVIGTENIENFGSNQENLLNNFNEMFYNNFIFSARDISEVWQNFATNHNRVINDLLSVITEVNFTINDISGGSEIIFETSPSSTNYITTSQTYNIMTRQEFETLLQTKQSV